MVIHDIYKRLKKNEVGSAFVELALVLPILLALLIGIIEFGWVFNGYITVTGAAREGARLAVVGEEDRINEVVEAHLDYYLHKLIDPKIGPPVIGDFGKQTSFTVSGGLDSLTGFIGGEGSIIPFPNIYPVNISITATMRQESMP